MSADPGGQHGGVESPNPQEVWEDSIDEGERRLERTPGALAATGFAGGAEMFFGILLLAVTSAALGAAMPEDTAHVIASLTFGIGFVFITLGRAELFTENFLLPVSAVAAQRSTVRALLRLWVITLLANFAGLALFGALFAVDGVLPSGDALDAAGKLADKLGERDSLPAFLSAIAGGAVMTLFTWIVTAADDRTVNVLASLIVGFVLAAATLNHAIVAFGEMFFGIVAGTAEAGWGEMVRNIALAIAGNLVGGIGLVFMTRLAQVQGEPD